MLRHCSSGLSMPIYITFCSMICLSDLFLFDCFLQHRVVSAMQEKGYNFWEKQDEDPRGISSAVERSYQVITSHILLWVPVLGHTPMLLHLVVFFQRKGFLWHAVAQDRLHKPPFDLSQSKFGKTSGAYSL